MIETILSPDTAMEAALRPEPKTLMTDAHLNVKERLEQMASWQTQWLDADEHLVHRLMQLDPRKKLDVQRGAQIVSLRRRLRMQLVRAPIEVKAEVVSKVGYNNIRQNLVEQFARLSKEQRLLWLNNLLFIMTPDLRRLNDKISKVRGYRSLGQQRNFLLGGASGMGKTTYLDWFTSNYLPQVETDRNHIPVIKIDAPVSNHTPKPLFQRMVLECGSTYFTRDNEEELLMLLALYFQKCGVEVVIVDEIEHITRPEIRRRLLEVSNLTRGVPIICASCHPLRWTEGDEEVAGRWNDYFELKSYTGQRLASLLAFIELLLPFTQDSSLALFETNSISSRASKITPSSSGPGLAKLIEQWTGGILRDIMILVADASARAIRQDLPCLTPQLLATTWQDIQTRQVTDFLAVLNQNQVQ